MSDMSGDNSSNASNEQFIMSFMPSCSLMPVKKKSSSVIFGNKSSSQLIIARDNPACKFSTDFDSMQEIAKKME
jgi:hypothetical protein